MPQFVAACFALVKKHNPDWDFRLFHEKNAKSKWGLEEPPSPENGDELLPAHKADWFRISAISEHGGVWTDASNIALQPIESWVNVSQNALQGFLVPNPPEAEASDPLPSPDGGETSMENWAFAAPARNPFVLQWKENFRHALTVGVDKYVFNLPKRVTGIFLANFSYLAQHNAWKEAVLQKSPVIDYFATPDQADLNADIRLMYSYRRTGKHMRGPFMYQIKQQQGGDERWEGAWRPELAVKDVMSCTPEQGGDCVNIRNTITPFLKFRAPERNEIDCPLEAYANRSWLATELRTALIEDEYLYNQTAKNYFGNILCDRVSNQWATFALESCLPE
jgi:hypothetical protein